MGGDTQKSSTQKTSSGSILHSKARMTRSISCEPKPAIKKRNAHATLLGLTRGSVGVAPFVYETLHLRISVPAAV